MALNYKILVDAQLNPAQLQAQLNTLAGGTQGVGATSTALQKQSNLWKQLTGDIGSTALKVAKFGALTAVIGGMAQGFYSMIANVREVDAALTEYKKVSDLTGESLQRFAMDATEAGIAVGRTGAEMIEASAIFKKSSFNDIESLQMAELSTMFQNIADAEISAADASSFLISQMKAFNITASDAMHILDATNEVKTTASNELYRLKGRDTSDRGKTLLAC